MLNNNAIEGVIILLLVVYHTIQKNVLAQLVRLQNRVSNIMKN